ncbi:helix-turn-helix domain-containing protein [Amycolatopsis lexingtonensis]|uniref:helix-turn-helix domain-containing protein n=1 Tax=Amycolatopsis lexingtonensis TaxID=218822 RepID=UPI000A3909C2
METEAWTSKGAATRARIIDAAAALLYERGIDQVGINDIRKATSTSHGQVFHYFPSDVRSSCRQSSNGRPGKRSRTSSLRSKNWTPGSPGSPGRTGFSPCTPSAARSAGARSGH